MSFSQLSPQDLATTLRTLDAQSTEIMKSLRLMHDIYTSTQTPKERSDLCTMYYELTGGSMIDTLIKMQENVNKVTVEGLLAMYKAEGINEGIESEEVGQTVRNLRTKFVRLNMEVEQVTEWIEEGAE